MTCVLCDLIPSFEGLVVESLRAMPPVTPLRTCYPIAESLNLPPQFHQDLHEDRANPMMSTYVNIHFSSIFIQFYPFFHFQKNNERINDIMRLPWPRKAVSSKAPGVAFDGSPIHCPALSREIFRVGTDWEFRRGISE